MPSDGSGDAVPLALYPLGTDTNNLTIFEGPTAESRPSRFSSSRPMNASPDGASPAGYSGSGSQTTSAPNRAPAIKGKGTVGTFLVGYQTYPTVPQLNFSTPPIQSGFVFFDPYVILDNETSQSQARNYEPWGGNLFENADIGNGFATTMQKGRWQGSVNPTITVANVTGGFFNQANVGLLCVHGSCGKSSESDGVTRSYLRFWNPATQSPSYCRLDDCSFGSPGTNGLKWMAILACNVLTNVDYDSLHEYGRLPINNDLHLLLSTASIATAAPTLGSLWAGNMLGDGTTNHPPETVEQSWFDAGSKAYQAETNHPLVIVFRVAGWPDALGDYLSDTGTSPGTGDPLDITKQDATVYSNLSP